MDKPESFDNLIKKGVYFHGHLGPFLIIGMRMGLVALKRLDAKGHFDMRAIVETGLKTPLSCIVDGVQMSTGCTLGKGNIKVIDKKKPKATFIKDDMILEIELKEDIFKFVREKPNEETANKIKKFSDDYLFLIKEGRPTIKPIKASR